MQKTDFHKFSVSNRLDADSWGIMCFSKRYLMGVYEPVRPLFCKFIPILRFLQSNNKLFDLEIIRFVSRYLTFNVLTVCKFCCQVQSQPLLSAKKLCTCCNFGYRVCRAFYFPAVVLDCLLVFTGLWSTVVVLCNRLYSSANVSIYL